VDNILITGSAGFIGFHLTKRLIDVGYEVIGLDCINDYYDVSLKYARLEKTGIHEKDIIYGKLVQSSKFANYKFIKLKLEDNQSILSLFKQEKFDIVCNLAAQAGVRYSIKNPHSYINSNIVGFFNILEGCRHYGVKYLTYASSSSVYGLNENMPFSTHHNVDHPISLYAASKKANELLAHTYSYLYKFPTAGLRFFTVYGPWGRPDMAIFLFTKAISEGRAIDVYNYGNLVRDFTHIDDIINGIVGVINNPPASNLFWTGKQPDPSSSTAPYKIYNIGNSNPIKLLDFIHIIEISIGKKAIMNFLPSQDGDLNATWSDIEDLKNDVGYLPSVNIEEGIKTYWEWYKEYYKIQ
jgi:UDP-glucuronate 4-epimerase